MAERTLADIWELVKIRVGRRLALERSSNTSFARMRERAADRTVLSRFVLSYLSGSRDGRVATGEAIAAPRSFDALL
jgi:hypothetical protein